MKKLLGIMFLGLLLITPSQADDIRDFQIEGISIGDSLLDYFSEEEIKKNLVDQNYKDNKFSIFEYKGLNSYETYENLQIGFKTKDKKYRIYYVDGVILLDDFKECYKKKDKIVNEISTLFENETKDDQGIRTHPQDPSGKSKISVVYFDLDSGNFIDVACYDWSEEIGFLDHLRVGLATKEWNDWVNKQY